MWTLLQGEQEFLIRVVGAMEEICQEASGLEM